MLALVIFLFPGFLFHLISQRDSYKRESHTWSFILNTTVYSFVITLLFVGILSLLPGYDHKDFFDFLITHRSESFKVTTLHHELLGIYLTLSLIIPILYYFLIYSQRPYDERFEEIIKDMTVEKPVVALLLSFQLFLLIFIQSLIWVLKLFIPQRWLDIKVETELSKVLFKNIGENVIIYLDNGKVYIGNLLSADLNPDVRIEERHIRLWPASSGYKNKENHRLILTTVYNNKNNHESVQITLPLSRIHLISPFVENVTSQFIAEGSIVFDLGYSLPKEQ